MQSPEPAAQTQVATPGETLLRVRDLTVEYRDEMARSFAAVDQAHFELRAGEVLGVLGESGAGKSTLGLALMGLLPTTAQIASGSIQFTDVELTRLREPNWRELRGAEIGFVFQEPGLALNPVLRVGTQIEEVIHAHQCSKQQGVRVAAEAALSEVGLGESGIFRAYPHELSGGQQQRVLIAQAIACRPKLLIADEPVSALDAVTRAEILALLGQLRERLGLAMVLISHELGSLIALADRVAVMYAGRIVEEGPTGTLLREPLHPYTRGLLAAQPRSQARERLAFIPGSPPDLGALPKGCAFEPRCSARTETCVSRPPGEVQPAPGRRVRCYEHGG
jgi:oligopeptide/dipeptide ABC transporter ATP-binding protein